MNNNVCPNPPSDLLKRCRETVPTTARRRPRITLEPFSRLRLMGLSLAAAVPVIATLILAPVRHYLSTPPVSPWWVTARTVDVSHTDIRELNWTPQDCGKMNCDARGYHGNLQIVFANGVKQTITGNLVLKLPADNALNRNPKIASDHQTAGWLVGDHFDIKRDNRELYFLPTQLMIYRNTGVIRPISGELPFIENWYFWNEGKQVALRSRRFHGVSSVALYDTATGKLIERFDGYKINASCPQWAQKLRD